ncbi:hypothetical protein GCM10023186_27890 [Hymenobacter koreensis]|uniref:Uncharacterized protein n=1 Tax=Hymenobacter koreensis TaxID=1084523 RepID=A0ABP8J5B1_9BACT
MVALKKEGHSVLSRVAFLAFCQWPQAYSSVSIAAREAPLQVKQAAFDLGQQLGGHGNLGRGG